MDSGRGQNEFNMAVSYLNRLNSLFYLADESSIRLDIHNWFHSLINIFRELSTEMTNDEINNFNQKISSINNLIQKNQSYNQRTGKNIISHDLYSELHNFELELRKILKESGLQNRLVDDAFKSLK